MSRAQGDAGDGKPGQPGQSGAEGAGEGGTHTARAAHGGAGVGAGPPVRAAWKPWGPVVSLPIRQCQSLPRLAPQVSRLWSPSSSATGPGLLGPRSRLEHEGDDPPPHVSPVPAPWSRPHQRASDSPTREPGTLGLRLTGQTLRHTKCPVGGFRAPAESATITTHHRTSAAAARSDSSLAPVTPHVAPRLRGLPHSARESLRAWAVRFSVSGPPRSSGVGARLLWRLDPRLASPAGPGPHCSRAARGSAKPARPEPMCQPRVPFPREDKQPH